MVLHDMLTPPQSGTATVLQSHSGTTQEDSGEGKSSQWAEVLAVYLVVDFSWKEKWPEVKSIPIHGLWPIT